MQATSRGTRAQAGAVIGLALAVFAVAIRAGAMEPLPDEEITEAIENRFVADGMVMAHSIDVETANGIVTLGGRSGSLLGRQRAVELARTIRGVRAVVDGITVRRSERSDEWLANEVERHLVVDPATEAYQLSVQVEDGVVRLEGTVDSWAERRLSERVAAAVSGVREIDNAIEVDLSAERSDADIAADVKRRLEIDTRLPAPLIEVSVRGGVVSLEGAVGSAAEKEQARLAAWVLGVRDVSVRGLEVEWWAGSDVERYAVDLSDTEVARAIADAWRYDPRLVSFSLHARVQGGVATLTGRVDNLKAKRAAAADASNTTGVWRVRNRLRVRPDPEVPDADLAAAVADALERDPLIRRYQIRAPVYGGVVSLYGNCGSRLEKDRAADVVSGVPGVIAVQNHLELLDTWQEKRDWLIQDDIEDALVWDPVIDEDRVSVSVEDGVATLRGSVNFWRQWAAAEEAAWRGGARRVRNHLTVRHGPVFYQP